MNFNNSEEYSFQYILEKFVHYRDKCHSYTKRYKELSEKYNSLANKYNKQNKEYEKIIEKHNKLVRKYNKESKESIRLLKMAEQGLEMYQRKLEAIESANRYKPSNNNAYTARMRLQDDANQAMVDMAKAKGIKRSWWN